MEKIGDYIGDHPKIMIALCGALVAVEAFKLFEACRWLSEAVVRAHLRELADDARMASEALGG